MGIQGEFLMNKQDTIEKLYEDHHKKVLEKLKKEKGEAWVKENEKQLQRSKEIFRASNLL